MNWVADSDPIVWFALWCGIGALGLTALLVIRILLLRAAFQARETRETRFLSRWRPRLLAAIDTVPVRLPRLKRRDWLPFLSLWNHFQESLRGAARHRLSAMALRMRMDLAARQLLQRGSPPEQLMGMLTLGHLGDRDSWDRIEAVARGPHSQLSLAAARALLLIDAASALRALLPLMASRADWPLSRTQWMLNEAGAEITSTMLSAALEDVPPDDWPRLVALMDAGHPDVVSPVIGRLLAGVQSEEVLIACLKSRHLPFNGARLLRLLEHPAWQVRAQAARVTGRMGHAEFVSALLTRLSDPVWWVRYRAAQSLVQLPSMSPEALWRARQTLNDRFGCEMLDQAVAERRGQ